ncbi:hypothetical protein J32TS6_14380 [Virgibacillus pantothenticus]|nr:hypothetical protein J32TS6_14380 [Virgibacillus pantothenticus]
MLDKPIGHLEDVLSTLRLVQYTTLPSGGVSDNTAGLFSRERVRTLIDFASTKTRFFIVVCCI